MNTRHALLFLVVASQAAFTSFSSAQQPVTPVRQRGQLIPPSMQGSQSASEAPAQLSSNYRITFSGTGADGKTLGELSTLTCAHEILVSGPLSDTTAPATFQVQGKLNENEGQLVFVYTIAFSVPVPVPVTDTPVAENRPRSVQFNNHSSSGTLLMQPGKTYEILKCGGYTYTLTAAPEPDK